MCEYIPKPKSLEANVKVERDLSNCATKTDLKNATGVDWSYFVKKIGSNSFLFVNATKIYQF